MKSSFLSMNQGCGEMSCMSFPVENFPVHATAQDELYRVPFPGSGSPSSQGISLRGLLAFGVALAHSFPPSRRGWRVTTEPSGSLSAFCCLLTQTGQMNESFIKLNTTPQTRKVNLAIAKAIINLMGQMILSPLMWDAFASSEFFPDLDWAQVTQLLWGYDSALIFGTSCSKLIMIVKCRAFGTSILLVIFLNT